MSNKIRTPISYHLRERRFWIDISILGALWILALTFPSDLKILSTALGSILKILALIATLDVIGFFSFHAMDAGKSILLQGFIGGFISSTGTFLSLCSRKSLIGNSTTHIRALIQALLLSMVAMLSECLLIISALQPTYFLRISLPIITQLGFILTLLLVTSKRSRPFYGEQSGMTQMIERPVIWVRVLKVSLLIIGLVALMQLIHQHLGVDTAWGAFFASFFEAHAVTAAAVSSPDLDPAAAEKAVLFILTGNSISKSLIAIRSGSKRVALWISSALMGSTFFAWMITLFI